MSGAIAAQVLHERFEQVRADEWRRLGKKVAHLDPLQRREVETIVGEVVRALAAEPARRLETMPESPIGDIALRLFGASHSMWSVGPVSDTQ
jgi:Glutamyl-tRNAGlu reductase, dimerisation domain